MNSRSIILESLKEILKKEDNHYKNGSFLMALRDARFASGRDLESGEPKDESKDGSWLGIMAYMVLLDQIGKAFRPRGLTIIDGYPIKKAIKYFSDLSDDDSVTPEVLYALRNAIMHDYSLFNVKKSGSIIDQNLTHRFVLVATCDPQIIKLPEEPWLGDYNRITSKNCTTVNVKAFADFVEKIYSKVVSLADLDKLEIALEGGVEEFKVRYFMYSEITIENSSPSGTGFPLRQQNVSN